MEQSFHGEASYGWRLSGEIKKQERIWISFRVWKM